MGMSYGNSRRRRDETPDIRDVVADAARDAGLSVPEFLDQALAEQREDERRSRNAGRRHLRVVEDDQSPLQALERRLSRGSSAHDGIPEDRVAGILEKAFDEIRASEQRTTAMIAGIARNLAGGAQPPSVRELMASAERRNAANILPFEPARTEPPMQATAAQSLAASTLEANLSRQEVERTLRLLERKIALLAPRSAQDRLVLQGMSAEIANLRAVVLADGAHVPLSAIAEPIQSLTERIAQLGVAAQSGHSQREAEDISPTLAVLDRRLEEVASGTAAMVSGIHDELVRLGRSGLNRNDAAVDASFDRLDARLQQLEAASREPLDRIRAQLDQIAGGNSRSQVDPELRSSIDTLERKFDALAQRIAQPIRMVHNAVTQLARQNSPDAKRLDSLFSELASLKRGMAEQGGAAQTAALQRQLAMISNRIEGIAHRMQQEQDRETTRDRDRKSIDEEIAEIKEMLREAASPCDDSRVLDAIGQLERKIAMLENSPQALMERLDRLHARLDERPVAGGGALPANIEVLLRNLAMRLETPPAPAADDRGLDRLHEELRSLRGKLESLPAGSGPALMPELAGVERSISDLFRQMDALKADVSDRAARAAADAVRDVQLLNPPMPMMPPAGGSEQIEASIGALRAAQLEAEQRTTRTLEALHDTLHKVVDRLTVMERDARAPAPPIAGFAPAAFAAPPVVAPPVVAPTTVPSMASIAADVFAPAAPAHPLQMPAAPERPPVFDDPNGLLPPDILEPRAVAPSAAAPPVVAPQDIAPPVIAPAAPLAAGDPAGSVKSSFAETLAQMRAGQRAGSAATLEAPEPKSSVASAFAAARQAMSNLRGSRSPEAATAEAREPQPPVLDAAPKKPAAAATPGDLDILLEPGAGRPRPAAPVAPQPAAAPQAASADPKAEFLAAARRAAQAAAQQSADVLAQKNAKSGGGKLSQLLASSGRKGAAPDAPAPQPAAAAAPEAVARTGFGAKHAILLGFAALLVAAGAGYTFMGANKRVEAPQQPPVRSSSLDTLPRPQRLRLRLGR